MALFGSKKKTDAEVAVKPAAKVKAPKAAKVAKAPKAAKPVPAAKPVVISDKNLTWVIKAPRITEKAAYGSEAGVYCFNISTDASKKDVSDAVAKMYNVVPLKDRTVVLPKKNVFVRGKWAVKGGGKKAYVYHSNGQTLEIE